MKKRFSLFTCFLIFCILLLTSCNNKKNTTEIITQKIITTHNWYYFTPTDIQQINEPQNAPKVIKKPWTESIRISGIGQTAFIESSQTENSVPKAYALVNRLGIVEFCKNEATLFCDKFLLQNNSTDGIVFMQGNPVFSIYKNIFFNDTVFGTQNNDLSVLVQFDTKAKTFFPIVNTKTLDLPQTAQVTDYFWDGNFWYYCIKNSTKEKTEFTYIKWEPLSTLLSITPEDAEKKNKISVINSSESEFRKCLERKSFSKAPDRIKKLFSPMPKSFSFELEVKTAGGPSPRFFVNEAKNFSEENLPKAKVQLADTWAGALFSDGTFYFSGALFQKRILENSKTLALRLPKLPENFIYTDFGISGSTLYVAWEESSFFEVGRAGFLCVDLEQVLYNE